MSSYAAAVLALANGTVDVEYTRAPRARFTELLARCTVCKHELAPAAGTPTVRVYDAAPGTRPGRLLARAVAANACACAWTETRC